MLAWGSSYGFCTV